MEPSPRCGHVLLTVPHQRGIYILGGEVWSQGEGSRSAACTNEIWRVTISVDAHSAGKREQQQQQRSFSTQDRGTTGSNDVDSAAAPDTNLSASVSLAHENNNSGATDESLAINHRHQELLQASADVEETIIWDQPEVAPNACFTPRYGHAMMVAKNGIGYLFGGRNETALFADTWKVDFSLVPLEFKRLVIGDSQTPPTRRFGHSFDYLREYDVGVVVGGSSDRGELKDAFLFDCLHEMWRELKTYGGFLPTGLANHRATPSPDGKSLFIFGGRKRTGELTQDLLKISIEMEKEVANRQNEAEALPLDSYLAENTNHISAASQRKKKRHETNSCRIPGSVTVSRVFAQNPDSCPPGRILHSMSLLADNDTLLIAGGQRVRTHRMLPPICADISIFSISEKKWHSVTDLPFAQRYHHASMPLSPFMLGRPSHDYEAVPAAQDFQRLSPSRQRQLDRQAVLNELSQEGICFIGGLPFSSHRKFLYRIPKSLLEPHLDALGGTQGGYSRELMGPAGDIQSQLMVQNSADFSRLSHEDGVTIPDPPLLLGNCFGVEITRHPTVGLFEHRDPKGIRQDPALLVERRLSPPRQLEALGTPQGGPLSLSASALGASSSPKARSHASPSTTNLDTEEENFDHSSLPPASPTFTDSFIGSPKANEKQMVVLGAGGITEELAVERRLARKYLLPLLKKARKRVRGKQKLQQSLKERGLDGHSLNPEAYAVVGSPLLTPGSSYLGVDLSNFHSPKNGSDQAAGLKHSFCKTCKTAVPSNFYALPCEHLVLCQHCKSSALKCVICDSFIKDSRLAMSANLPHVLQFLAEQEAAYESDQKKRITSSAQPAASKSILKRREDSIGNRASISTPSSPHVSNNLHDLHSSPFASPTNRRRSPSSRGVKILDVVEEDVARKKKQKRRQGKGDGVNTTTSHRHDASTSSDDDDDDEAFRQQFTSIDGVTSMRSEGDNAGTEELVPMSKNGSHTLSQDGKRLIRRGASSHAPKRKPGDFIKPTESSMNRSSRETSPARSKGAWDSPARFRLDGTDETSFNNEEPVVVGGAGDVEGPSGSSSVLNKETLRERLREKELANRHQSERLLPIHRQRSVSAIQQTSSFTSSVERTPVSGDAPSAMLSNVGSFIRTERSFSVKSRAEMLWGDENLDEPSVDHHPQQQHLSSSLADLVAPHTTLKLIPKLEVLRAQTPGACARSLQKSVQAGISEIRDGKSRRRGKDGRYVKPDKAKRPWFVPQQRGQGLLPSYDNSIVEPRRSLKSKINQL